MLERLGLKDFQCHESLEVLFDPYVTTLVGESDAGKSAVLRALRWLALNQPQGDDFVGDFGGADFARVVLEVDGHEITRYRGRKGNTYKLDGRTYKSFGTGVPKPIADLLNLSSFNFQDQIEPPLWFTESAPEVGRRLNQIVNLGAVDEVLRRAAESVRQSKSRAEVSRDRLKEARGRKRELSWVKECDSDFEAVERLSEQTNSLNERIVTLSDCVRRARIDQDRKKRLTGVVEAGRAWRPLYSRLAGIRSRIAVLQSLVDAIEGGAKLAKAPLPDLGPATQAKSRCDDLAQRAARLAVVVSSIEDAEYGRVTAELEIESIRDRITRETKGRCPTCGAKLKPSQSFAATFTCPTSPLPAAPSGPRKSGTTCRRRT